MRPHSKYRIPDPTAKFPDMLQLFTIPPFLEKILPTGELSWVRVHGIRPHAMVPVRCHIQYVTSDTSRTDEVGSDCVKTICRDTSPGLLSPALCLEVMILVLNFGSTPLFESRVYHSYQCDCSWHRYKIFLTYSLGNFS